MSALSASATAVVDELVAMVEPLHRGRRKRPSVTLVERGEAYEIYRNGRRGPTLLASGDLGELGRTRLPREALSRPVEVRLDGSRVLSKTLHLPAASRNYLDAVVGNQLERMTPWSADRVVFDFIPLDGEPVGKDQIAVRLVATSREVFDASMARLSEAGIKPAVVGTSDDPLDQPSVVDLLRSGRTERRATLRRRVSLVLLALIIVGIAASAYAGWRYHEANAAAAALQAEMDAARNAVEAARASSEIGEGYQRLLALRSDALPMVVLLDRISETIPTSTYLSELIVEEREMRIAGFSSEAPALIGILEAADILTDVRFAAPTIRGEGGTQDQFQIVGRIAAPGEPTQ
jgi:Tfp pilus assembly protein PilN